MKLFKKKCSDCKKKVNKKFSYCPWCGYSFDNNTRAAPSEQDWGMLGNNDKSAKIENQVKLPFGFNGIINTLMKQIEKDLANIDPNAVEGSSMPNKFKIQISTGAPKVQVVNQNNNENVVEKQIKEPVEIVSEQERKRRAGLERIDAKSTIRRLPEGVVYEIETPGVKSNKDVIFTKLEKSLEIKAYSQDKCYVKIIPMKVEILGIVVKNEKIFLKVKG